MIKYSNWLDEVKALGDRKDVQWGGIGAGAGALLSGGLTALSKRQPGEDPGERRGRILRNAMLGAVMGGGAGAAMPMAGDMWSQLAPPATTTEKTVDAFKKEFGGNLGSFFMDETGERPFMGSIESSLSLGALGSGGIYGKSVLDRRNSIKDLAQNYLSKFRGALADYENQVSSETQKRIQGGKKVGPTINNPTDIARIREDIAKTIRRSGSMNSALGDFVTNWGKVKVPTAIPHPQLASVAGGDPERLFHALKTMEVNGTLAKALNSKTYTGREAARRRFLPGTVKGWGGMGALMAAPQLANILASVIGITNDARRANFE